jgi:cyclic pyranopterin phosphate synthase
VPQISLDDRQSQAPPRKWVGRAENATPACETSTKHHFVFDWVIYPFEEPNDDLIWIPLAARRALDRAGYKLSLTAWRGLGMAERRALIATGTARTVSEETVGRLVGRAEPAPRRITPLPETEASQVPDALQAALGERAAELVPRWQALEPLERYALEKLVPRGEGGRPGRLFAALDHFVGRSPRPSHLGEQGEAKMVDVSEKSPTKRVAVARARLSVRRETLEALASGRIQKGDPLAAARIAGIQAAKRTPELIPLCHGVALTSVDLALELVTDPPSVLVTTTARAFDRTGVEMEALVGASVAALTLYDMLKSIDREMSVGDVTLLEKSGGRSGHYRRSSE